MKAPADQPWRELGRGSISESAGGEDRLARPARAAHGREALPLTEVKIAVLVARGDSTSGRRQGMVLSRRTVQTYISRVLTKPGAKNQGGDRPRGAAPGHLARARRPADASPRKCRHMTTTHGAAWRVPLKNARHRAQLSRVMDIQCDDCLTLFGEADDNGEVPAGSSSGARGA